MGTKRRSIMVMTALVLIVTLVVTVIPALATDPNFGIETVGSTSYPTGTLGYTVNGNSHAEFQGTLSAQKIVVPAGGATIISVSLPLYSGRSGTFIRQAIYTNNSTSDNPDILVPGSDTGSRSAATAGVNTYTYPTPVCLAAGTYWLAHQSSNGGSPTTSNPHRYYDTVETGAGRRARNFSYGAFPETFGTPTTSDNLYETVYMTYVQCEICSIGQIGRTTIEPFNGCDRFDGTLSARKFIVPSGGAMITSVNIWLCQGGGTCHWAVYTNTVAPSGVTCAYGYPGTLVAGSDTGDVNPPTGTFMNWYTVTYSTPFYLAEGTYWLAHQSKLLAGTTTPMRRYSSAGSAGRVKYTRAYGAFPGTFGSGSAQVCDNLNECEYLTYNRSPKAVAKATKAMLPTCGNVTSVSFYSHATGNARLAIYSDGASPSSLLWESNNTTVSQDAWTTVDISAGTPASLMLPSGTYWLAWQWGSLTSGPSYTAGSAGDGNYICLTYGAYPTSWSGGTSSNETWSIYASYEICTAVGGYAYPVNRLGILAPWVALFLFLIAGAAVFFVRRNRVPEI